MTRRILFTILAVVTASLIVAGVGTAVLSAASSRRAAKADVRDLTAALVEVARLSRTPTVGVVEDCSAIRLPARRRACERRLEAAEDTQSTLVADRESLRENLRLQGISFILLDDTGQPLNSDGSPAETTDLPDGVPSTAIDAARLIEGQSTEGSTRRLAWAASGARLEARPRITVAIVASRTYQPVFNSAMRWFALAAILAWLMAAAVSVWLSRRLTRPVLAATDATHRIAGGDWSARLAESNNDPTELRDLTRSVNTLAESLERSRGLERQFLMSISHDLRTPLTNIAGYAEAISDGALDDPAHGARVIGSEAARLERLVTDLLDLARLESAEFAFHPAEVDVTTVVASAVDAARARADAAGVALNVRPCDPIRTTIDPERLTQVVANLLANAVNYASSSVEVVAETTPDGYQITVSDDGPGIPDADLPHVFERLYRAAHQPARAESGSGLGLAIVAQLVAGMGGTVEMRRGPKGTGTAALVSLPTQPGRDGPPS